MSLVKIGAISVGATLVTWIALISFNGDQTLDRLGVLLIGYIVLTWGLL